MYRFLRKTSLSWLRLAKRKKRSLQIPSADLSLYLHRKYQDLSSEIEWWGVYDPSIFGVVVYLIFAVPIGHLFEKYPELTDRGKELVIKMLLRKSNPELQEEQDLEKRNQTQSPPELGDLEGSSSVN